MISFLLGLLALVLGYMFYGRFVERAFGPNPNAVTPAVAHPDGMDYIVMPSWKIFMIQLLNIAGTGPIFGAIMGAKFGPSAYLWIVIGCIFGGAVHDYLTGMMSLRHDGASLPDIIGRFLGENTMKVMLCFSLIMLILVGAVFVYSPALILGDIAGDGTSKAVLIWAGIVFIYYIIATLLPIDKIIGRIYPLFAIALIFMALSLLICLIVKWPSIPELWDGLGNRGPEVGVKGQPLFPCLFITIACGAISGFHATQSPLMARCMKNEKLGRPIFYGSMITEGIIAMIWATVSSYVFFGGGMEDLGLTATSAPTIVTTVSKSWLGKFGGILAVLGVVAAPITSGDTALRSARLIVAEAFHIDQTKVSRRLMICIPLFTVTGLMLAFNIKNEDGFNVIWRYFGWANQTLSVFSLWAITSFLCERRDYPRFLISLIPAILMTSVCVTYISVEKIGFNLPNEWIPYIAGGTAVLSLALFLLWYFGVLKKNIHK